ncbi:MAG: hypothetical protein GXO55_06280 [Chloroflexi bacterium]|nr:hypothetical protein [Chloroflexota bacterium]
MLREEEKNEHTCWICGAPAVTTCRQCGQPVCQAHLKPIPDAYVDLFGPDGCEVCVTRTLEALDLSPTVARPVVEPPPEERTCAYDGKVFPTVLPTCEVCGRRVCHEHRYRYRRKVYVGSEDFKSTYYWEYKIRCWEHPWRWHRLKGWEQDPDDVDDGGI